MDRETLLYALLFSVPPAIGLVGFFTVLLGDGPVNPWGLAIGGAIGGAIFVLIAVGADSGSPDEEGIDGGNRRS